MARNEQMVMIEDAQLAFLNFEGKEDDYNRAGNRNFSILLDEETAASLAADGYNVKTLKAREEGDEPRPYITVNVGYKIRPPKIVLVTSKNRTMLHEDDVAMLDYADIDKVDLIFTPHNWSVRGETGVKGYLKTMYVWINEDPLELKYAELFADDAVGAPEESFE